MMYDQSWVLEQKTLLLKVLEADFDPHLKRISPNSLKFVAQSTNADGDDILELITEVLEYGGCSGVSHDYPQNRRLKIKPGSSDLAERMEAML